MNYVPPTANQTHEQAAQQRLRARLRVKLKRRIRKAGVVLPADTPTAALLAIHKMLKA